MKFIGDRVEVSFGARRGFAKRPECPAGFTWGSELHVVKKCLSEWRDYTRRGKMSHNMRPSHLVAAAKRGSRGVGKFFFRVLTEDERVFDLYFDRAPNSALEGSGSWYLLRELESGDEVTTDAPSVR